MNPRGSPFEDLLDKIRAAVAGSSIQSRILILCIIVSGLLLSYLSILKHITFNTYAWDLGVFDQTLWFTLRGQIFWNTPDFGHLHLHFDPILFLVLPLYAMWQSPSTLLIIQAFMAVLGAIPVYLLGKHSYNDRNVGLVLGVSFLLYPPLHQAINFDFHPDAFIPFFLLSTYYFYRTGKFKQMIGFTVLALMCKETVAFVTMFFGLYIAACSFRRQLPLPEKQQELRVGLTIAVLSLTWFAAALRIMSVAQRETPFYAIYQGQNIFLSYWSQFGDSLPQIVRTALLDPVKVLSALANMSTQKIRFGLTLLLPVGFLSLLDPVLLLVNIPWLLIFYTGVNPYFWHSNHYIAVFIPFTFIAAINGANTLSKMRWLRKVQIPHGKKEVTMVLAVSTLFGILLFSSYTAVNSLQAIREATNPTLSIHSQALLKVIELIPENASVMTQNELFPHISHRTQAYPGYNANLSPDYILADMTKPGWHLYFLPGHPQYAPIGPHLKEIWLSAQYGIVASIDGVLLLGKGYSNQRITVLNNLGLRGTFTQNSTGTQFQGVYLNLISAMEGYTFTKWETYPPFPTVPHPFTVDFTGYLFVREAGTYRFKIESDGPARLQIGAKEILNSVSLENATVLESGYHQFTVKYHSSDEAASISVYWQTPGSDTFEPINPTALVQEAA